MVERGKTLFDDNKIKTQNKKIFLKFHPMIVKRIIQGFYNCDFVIIQYSHKI